MPLIWVNREAEYFFEKDWTTQITLIGLGKFVFTRNRRGGRIRPMARPEEATVARTPVRERIR
jgi:hypothetical protein